MLSETLCAARRSWSASLGSMRALASVPLNIAEAKGRAGRDRLHHFRTALGSLRELGAALARLGGVLYGPQRGAPRGPLGSGSASGCGSGSYFARADQGTGPASSR